MSLAGGALPTLLQPPWQVLGAGMLCQGKDVAGTPAPLASEEAGMGISGRAGLWVLNALLLIKTSSGEARGPPVSCLAPTKTGSFAEGLAAGF